MNVSAPPSLFGTSLTPPLPPQNAAPRPSASLADLLYDGFYLIFLLRNRLAPTDADSFSAGIGRFLEEFEREAKRISAPAEDIFAAKYAFCATVDEAILSSRFSIRDAWERRPLQLELFGDQLAGEHFYDRLEVLRNHGRERLQALEVFHMCLLLGFQGRYMLEGPEKLSYLTAQIGEQIAHLKGRRAPFAPHGERPDHVNHVLRREFPIWVMSSMFALFGLIAYLGIGTFLQRETRMALHGYDEIVQLAPRAPSLKITLP